MTKIKFRRIPIGLGLIAFSFLWAKIGPLIGVGLTWVPIPQSWHENLPISPWQLWLSSWIIFFLGLLIAGKEGWIWIKMKWDEKKKIKNGSIENKS